MGTILGTAGALEKWGNHLTHLQWMLTHKVNLPVLLCVLVDCYSVSIGTCHDSYSCVMVAIAMS